MSTRYCVERIPLGSKGIRFDVCDSYENDRIVKSFFAVAPLDPDSSQVARDKASAYCGTLNKEDSLCSHD